MRHAPRGLTEEEAALWARVASSVRPLHPPRVASFAGVVAKVEAAAQVPPPPAPRPKRKQAVVPPQAAPAEPAKRATPRPLDASTLDASWDRKLTRGVVDPDFSLDLHGHTLDSAHARLDHGLMQALAHGARVVLLITGRPRPQDDNADRGSRRGAIRAKVLDWLAAGPYGSRIAAVRTAHSRHGGAGALYIVLKRPR